MMLAQIHLSPQAQLTIKGACSAKEPLIKGGLISRDPFIFILVKGRSVLTIMTSGARV